MKESLQVKAVTFYQSVRIDGTEFNTVNNTLSRLENIHIVFCDDKIFMRNKDWKQNYAKDTVLIVGLHNVRHMTIKKDAFIASAYSDVFNCIKKVKDDVVVAPTPLAEVPAAPVAAKPSTEKIYTRVDDADFEGMEPDEKSILLKLELKRFRIDFDNRWGVAKLLNQFNTERAKM